MTREEFEARWCADSGIDPNLLHLLTLGAVPCDCGSERCEGWKMDLLHPV